MAGREPLSERIRGSRSLKNAFRTGRPVPALASPGTDISPNR
jgi:hypothetical protein